VTLVPKQSAKTEATTNGRFISSTRKDQFTGL